MKVLIRENLQTKEINIYGTDGKLHTGEFFDKYFSDTGGAYPTLPYEREEFQTDAEWTIITETDFRQLAETISVIQKAIVSKKAEELGLRVGAYVKKMAIQGEIKRYDLSELRDITRSFRMIGTELNQIAKVANSTGEVTGKAVEEIKRQYDILDGVFENYLKPLKPNVIL